MIIPEKKKRKPSRINKALVASLILLLLAALSVYFSLDTDIPPVEEVVVEPAEYLIHFEEGSHLIDRGEYSLAVTEFNQALVLHGDDVDIYMERGFAYWRMDLHRAAIADFSRAIELNPNYSLAYNNRCWVLVELGQYEEALSDCNQAIRLSQSSAYYFNSRCWANAGVGQYDKALQDCNQGIEIDPSYPFNYTSRANVYYLQGQYDKALEDYCRSFELLDNFNVAHVRELVEKLSYNRIDRLGGCS